MAEVIKGRICNRQYLGGEMTGTNRFLVDGEVGEVREDEAPKIAADALFNFMREYDYLKKIINNMAINPRYYSEDISYLKLEKESQKINEWYIPMTCFCDIPLHQIAYHAQGTPGSFPGYGKFAIAFYKKFGIDKGIQPIHYLNEKSIQVKELSLAMNSLLKGVDDSNQNERTMSDFLMEYIRMIKPYIGNMKPGDGKEYRKNFHDEHEWRYIPKLDPKELPLMLLDSYEISAEKNCSLFTNSISETKDAPLSFEVKDIKYIFVDTIENRDNLIKFIKEKRRGKRLSPDDKRVLTSKIMVYDELKGDW